MTGAGTSTDPADRPRSAGERLLDACFALTVGSWAVAAWRHADAVDRASPVLWSLLAAHVTVAVLLVRRTRSRRSASWRTIAACAPALLTGGVAWRLAPPPSEWPVVAVLVFALGAALAVGSLATLGRSFAILPAVRHVVTRGPYRVVRHPAYAGELAMVVACVVAAPAAVWLVPLTIACVALRIVAEERHLASSDTYRAYVGRVPYRLVPLIW